PCARQSPFPSQMPSSAKIATIRSGLWASSQMSQYSAFSLLIASMSWRTVRRFSSSALSMSATLLRRRRGIQKESRVFNKQLWVLVVRAMIGVGVDDQLRIRHVLLHDERVHRGYVHVVTAVHDECLLLDRLQIVGGPFCWTPHLRIASTWAFDTLSFTSGSRPSFVRCVAFRTSRPPASAA